MSASDDVLILDVRLSRSASEEAARLVVLRVDAVEPPPGAHEWLHPHEAQKAANMKSEVRRKAFVAGRIAAKRALLALRPGLSAQRIEIGAGVFGQPVVVGEHVGDLSVSIAHCEGMAAAIAFPQGHPLGLDVEALAAADEATLHAFILREEIAPDLERREALLRAWCAKESLGKTLRCGLTAAPPVLALQGDGGEGPFWRGRYVAHTQYAFLTLCGGGYVFALAHPARTRVLFESQRLLAFLA